MRIGSIFICQEDIFGIGNINQKQRIARNGCPCLTTILLFDDATESINGKLTTPHLEKRTHNGTNHITQKTVGLNREYPSNLIHLCPGSMHYLAIISFDVGMQFTEAGEIGIIEQCLCSFIHPFKVGSLKKTATVLPVERYLCRSDVILIHSCRGIKAGMCIRLYGTQAIDRNIRRKQTIQFICHKSHIERLVAIKMCHHQRSMHTGIGASGTYYLDFTAQ